MSRHLLFSGMTNPLLVQEAQSPPALHCSISYMNIEKDILKPDLISFTNWGGGSWTLLGGQLDCSTLMTSLIFSLLKYVDTYLLGDLPTCSPM